MEKREITKIIRSVLKEVFDKSDEVSPTTVNNLQGNEPEVLSEPLELCDTLPGLINEPPKIADLLTK